MKRLEISRLMDEYVDDEFFPQEGSAVDAQAVKGRVLANAKPGKAKKQMPRKKWLALAAALAAVLVVLTGAGFLYIQHNLARGALTFEQTADSRITSYVHYGPMVKLEDGRLFFCQDDDQRTDITDLVSVETPYIFDRCDPDENMTYYIIVGGTPDRYGYFEWITAPDPFADDADPGDDLSGMTRAYEFSLVTADYGTQFFGGLDTGSVVILPEDEMNFSWLLAGLNELGIAYSFAPLESLKGLGIAYTFVPVENLG